MNDRQNSQQLYYPSKNYTKIDACIQLHVLISNYFFEAILMDIVQVCVMLDIYIISL